MKHYMDIENLRELDIDLGDGMIRPSNCGAFAVGDRVTITEKIDGSNFSIRRDPESGTLQCFSRKKELVFNNTLNGAWNYAQTLSPDMFPHGMIVFGEWTGAKNKIVYDREKTGKWYVFDIFDEYSGKYMPWDVVRKWCESRDIPYAHLLYDGPFVSWDHCRSFTHSPFYGDIQEGVVVKNQSKIDDDDIRLPIYLKIVNDEFKESVKVGKPKITNPEVSAAKARAEEFTHQIVTRARVEKILHKMRDEGILGDTIVPSDMKTVASALPKRVYMDCVKEEPEILLAMGEYGGKAINARAMQLAREILL